MGIYRNPVKWARKIRCGKRGGWGDGAVEVAIGAMRLTHMRRSRLVLGKRGGGPDGAVAVWIYRPQYNRRESPLIF